MKTKKTLNELIDSKIPYEKMGLIDIAGGRIALPDEGGCVDGSSNSGPDGCVDGDSNSG